MSALYSCVSPRELIPGDADELLASAARLSTVADELDRAAAHLGATDPGSWQGTAAGAFRGVMGEQPRQYRAAADSFAAAARALSIYAQALEAAQSDAAHAMSLHDEAEAASAAWSQRRQLAHGLSLEITDPGDEGRARASQLLAAAQQEASSAAQQLATSLGAAQELAPRQAQLQDTLLGQLAAFARTHRNDLATVLFVKELFEKGRKVREWDEWTKAYAVARSWRAAVPGVSSGEGGQLTFLDEAQSLADGKFPTANNGFLMEHFAPLLSRAPGALGDAGAWLTSGAATPWFRGFGIAGGLLTMGIGVHDFVHDWEHHADAGKLGVDATSAAFGGATVLALAFPEVAVPVVATAALLWGGAELYEHRDWIDHEGSRAVEWEWDHSAPGVLWHNRKAIEHVLDSGTDIAGNVATDIGHGVSHAWHSVI